MGFGPVGARATAPQLLNYDGDGHLMAISPTEGGKGRSCVVPALLTYPGPIFCIDVKGENYHITARRRRQMGHHVVALDPFRLVVKESDGLNPFDLYGLPGGESDCDSELLTDLVAADQPLSSKDLFWELCAKGLLTGIIGLVAEEENPAERNIGRVLDLLHADDVDYSLAVYLDTHKFANDVPRKELVAYLQHEAEKCRPSVRSTAQAYVKALGSRAVRAALARTTFDLAGWVRGDPIDIFLIFPADRLRSHRAVVRLWVGTLITALLRRTGAHRQRTLLLLDEIAQLGPMPPFLTALTLLRGYGVQVYSCWQDLSQLKANYPADWETMLNNTAVVQAFGLANGMVARSVAELFGTNVQTVLGLGRGDQLLMRPGEPTVVSRRVDYLTDRLFAGLFDPNPRHAEAAPRPVVSQAPAPVLI
jgi:type IV secretion system protein VirD4